MIFNVIILWFNLIIKDSLMLKDVENCGIQRKFCIQKDFLHSAAFKNFRIQQKSGIQWKRIPAIHRRPKKLAFSGNPQTIPFIFKNLKIFGIQRNLKGQGSGYGL